MTLEKLAEDLVPIAAELVGTVRDYGPDDVAAVLARVPGGRHDALAVVLAAMVNPDETTGHLLAWIDYPEPQRAARSDRKPREHGTLRGYRQHFTHGDPTCRACRDAHTADRARRRDGQAVA